jgi:predicted nucleotide-binding protein
LVEMGVPAERVADVLALILESAEGLGLIQEIKNKKYVNISSPGSRSATLQEPPSPASTNGGVSGEAAEEAGAKVNVAPLSGDGIKPNKRVFVTHGKSQTFVEPIKKLLSFGELEAVVAVERQSVSQPVPDKVMNDMRSCSAAIIHVEDELKLIDKDTNEHIILNPNVLIEIGAAMALFGKRFILLVKEGVKLPSNLQGLYEVRYSGDVLDGNATIRLLEAINELKKQPQS